MLFRSIAKSAAVAGSVKSAADNDTNRPSRFQTVKLSMLVWTVRIDRYSRQSYIPSTSALRVAALAGAIPNSEDTAVGSAGGSGGVTHLSSTIGGGFGGVLPL